MKKYMQILIIMPVSIGDIILTTPIIRQLRIKYKDIVLSYAVQEGVYSQVIENNPFVDHIILLKNNYRKSTFKGDFVDIIKSEIKDIKKYDLVIQFRDENGQIEQRNFSNDLAIKYFAKKAGVVLDDIIPEVFVNRYHDNIATEILKSNMLLNKNICVISPYGKCQWNYENYAYIMEYLHIHYKMKFIVIGGGLDQPFRTPNTINIFNEHLETVAAVMKRACLFLGVDSGMSHLAGTCNIPMVVIVFPALPRIWRPLSKNAVRVFGGRRVIRNFTSISNCKKEKVISACEELLSVHQNNIKIEYFYPWD